MLYRCLLSPVPSDKLEGNSLMYSVVAKLFVECFRSLEVCLYLFTIKVFVCRCPFLVNSARSRSLTFWLIKA